MLNIFETLNIDEQKLHQKYKIIRDKLNYTGEQEVLKDWVKSFKDRCWVSVDNIPRLSRYLLCRDAMEKLIVSKRSNQSTEV